MRKIRRNNKYAQPLQKADKHRINERIKAETVRLIYSEGEQVGVKTLEEALALADAEKLDLVEIAPTASPPVCKIIDYGKYKYRLQKKEAEAKKNQTDNALKELKIGYCTDVGDLNTKLRQARKFLSDGNKVKVSMRFKGREKAFTNLGKEKLEKIVEQLSDISELDELNSKSRSVMHIILTPS